MTVRAIKILIRITKRYYEFFSLHNFLFKTPLFPRHFGRYHKYRTSGLYTYNIYTILYTSIALLSLPEFSPDTSVGPKYFYVFLMQFNFVAHAPKNIYFYASFGDTRGPRDIFGFGQRQKQKCVNVCRREPSNSDLNKSNFVKKKTSEKREKRCFSSQSQSQSEEEKTRKLRLIGRHSGPTHGSHSSNASSQQFGYATGAKINLIIADN